MPEEILETPQPQPEAGRPLDDGRNWPKIILAVALGFGLLAGSAYAGYWYGTQQVQSIEKPSPTVSQPTSTPTPTPTQAVEDETKDWEAYTNKRYGYQVKYPSDVFELSDQTEVDNNGNGKPDGLVFFLLREDKYQFVEISSETDILLRPNCLDQPCQKLEDLEVLASGGYLLRGGLYEGGDTIFEANTDRPMVVIKPVFGNLEQKAIMELMLSTFRFLD